MRRNVVRSNAVRVYTFALALLALCSVDWLAPVECSIVPVGTERHGQSQAVHQLSEAMTPSNTYAIIVSGSRYWFNYRHSANALAVYTLLRRAGVPDNRIILMLAEDHSSKLNNRYLGSVYLAEREAPISAVPASLRGPGNDSDSSGAAFHWLDEEDEVDRHGTPVHVATNAGGSTSLEQLIAVHAAEAAAAAAAATAHIPARERARLSLLSSQDAEVDFSGGGVTAGALLGVITGRHRLGTPPQQRFAGLPTRRASNAQAHEQTVDPSRGASDHAASGPSASASPSSPHLLLYMTGHGGDGFLKLSDKEEIAAPDLAAALASALRSGRFSSATALFDTCQAATLHEAWWTPGGVAFSSSVRGQNSYAYGVDSAAAGLGQALSDGFTRLLWDHLAATSVASGPLTAAAAASAAAAQAAFTAAYRDGAAGNVTGAAVASASASAHGASFAAPAGGSSVGSGSSIAAEVPLSLADAVGIALKRRGAAKAVKARLAAAAQAASQLLTPAAAPAASSSPAAQHRAGAATATATATATTTLSAAAAIAAGSRGSGRSRGTGSGGSVATSQASFAGGFSDALAAIAPWRIGSTVTAHAGASAPLHLLARLASELQPAPGAQHDSHNDAALHLASVTRGPLQRLLRSRAVIGAGASLAAAAADVLRSLGVPAESALAFEEAVISAAAAVLGQGQGYAAHGLAPSVVEACLPLMRVHQDSTAPSTLTSSSSARSGDSGQGDELLRLVQGLLHCDAEDAEERGGSGAVLSAQQLSACRDGRAALARCSAAVLEPAVAAAVRTAQATEHAAAQKRLLAAHGIGGEDAATGQQTEQQPQPVGQRATDGGEAANPAPSFARRSRARGAAPVHPFADALLSHLPLGSVFADGSTGSAGTRAA